MHILVLTCFTYTPIDHTTVTGEY